MLMVVWLGLLAFIALAPIVVGCGCFFAWRVEHGWRRVVAWLALPCVVLWIVAVLRWWDEAEHTPP